MSRLSAQFSFDVERDLLVFSVLDDFSGGFWIDRFDKVKSLTVSRHGLCRHQEKAKGSGR